MQTYIVLLRGVTPTGKNKVLMAPLRAALEQAGLRQVQTYIQSGNVVAQSQLPQADLEAYVHTVIANEFGGDITVLARTAAQLETILADNPFTDADPGQLYVTLLATQPAAHLVDAFFASSYAPHEVAVVDDRVYVRCATVYRDVKATNTYIERKLGVRATTRVHNTLARLVAMSASR